MPILRLKNTTTSTEPLNTEPAPAESELSSTEIKDCLRDPWWRINNLYYVKDKDGLKVKFTPWPEQAHFYWHMHYLNVILKARQRGITTIIQIVMLDACLFNENINAGVIAHNREDAQKFFKDKIKFAYDNLPDALKNAIASEGDNKNELEFSNGSSIRVGTSMRSGTLQYLHISEYGKICAKYPDKAEEIKTGSLNTVKKGNFIFIESTAEGAFGHFFELCKKAENMQLEGHTLTIMDYKFFFYPWWQAEEYKLNEPVEFLESHIKYFDDLEKKHGITLTHSQKAWYVKKLEEQGDKMTREYPSHPEEAFLALIKGAILGTQMRALRKRGGICDVPYVESIPVNTFWDIGRDTTAIWFHQRVGVMNHFINYYGLANHQIAHFAHLLLQDTDYEFHKYTYGVHYFPHDMGVTDYSSNDNKTRLQVAEGLGLKPARVVDRILVLEDGIDMTRQALSTSVFDRVKCADGILGLDNYRYNFDDKLLTYTRQPVHNWASHPADSYRQFAQGYRDKSYYGGVAIEENPLLRAARTKKSQGNDSWRV